MDSNESKTILTDINGATPEETSPELASPEAARTEDVGAEGALAEGSEAIAFDSAIAPVVPQPQRGRPMQKARFAWGMLLSTAGIGLMLVVAAGALRGAGVNGHLTLPVVGLCMIIGLMLLGGGFGVMATASPTFDDDEFDRLMQAGDASLPDLTLADDTATPEDLRAELRRDEEADFRNRDNGRQVPDQSVA